MTTKTCTKCGETKPTDQFGKDRTKRDGLQSNCKDCQRAHREANRDKILARQRSYREANRDKINAYDRAYNEANREKRRAYREANRDKINEQKRTHYEANRDEIAARQRAYNEANREQINARDRARYALVGSPGGARAREVTARYATRTGEPWTPEEDRYILTDPGTIMDKALQLSRTHSAVESRARQLRQENAA